MTELIKPITIWSRLNLDTKSFQHNHIEDGSSPRERPVGDEMQMANWAKAEWKKEYGYLINNKVYTENTRQALPIEAVKAWVEENQVTGTCSPDFIYTYKLLEYLETHNK